MVEPVESIEAGPRRVLLVTHTGRDLAVEVARQAHRLLTAAGLLVRLIGAEAEELALDPAEIADDPDKAAQDVELIIVLGGDGSILRGAELARPHGTPVLGVNLGHVGFLAEAEVDDLERIVEVVVDRSYTVEERMTLAVDVFVGDDLIFDTWALNEASVEKAAREKMLEVLVEVDGRPLSRWGCDGVVVATPTGSTAYAFSAGGPVVWPDVEAILLVPLSAHALFSRPIVVAPGSQLTVELIAAWHGRGVLWCDGRRMVEVPPGARIQVRRGKTPVRLARAHEASFTDRLVAKFDLPVLGWRGAAEHRRKRSAQEEI
ncbi:ATP-NAD/AcoX kinase [Kribbella flavida DSM 17836]|uniref:NAD kinase n=1 Tax=Kribbella flavida (strain DSM 17836 / JCM 10339 / NBRC 14399) TaxID=479435 RepID=D2PM64_KRIFD|nr:NAD kinase [Kribbella flavida]ADB34432.1 ATP-NAD/AcoX kinase [Kribbella flavida DSM 17836]